MTIIYPDRRDYYDDGDPYCYRFGCPHADDCNPEECELLEQEMVELEHLDGEDSPGL